MTAAKYPFTQISCNSMGGIFILILIVQATKPIFCLYTLQEHKNVDMRYNSFEGDSNLPIHKRTLISGGGVGGSHGQPEEIFSANDQLELNYDEYPVS